MTRIYKSIPRTGSVAVALGAVLATAVDMVDRLRRRPVMRNRTEQPGLIRPGELETWLSTLSATSCVCAEWIVALNLRFSRVPGSDA